MTPEFSRPQPRPRIPPAGQDITVEATAAECAALAARLRLPAVQRLTCRFHLRPAPNDGVTAEGWLAALVTQTCVVSLDDFDAAISEHFTLHFVAAGTESNDVDPETDDEVPYTNDTIDLGEAATEQLALALDPWPRKPGATLPDAGTAAPAPRPS
ncbi:MAG TPA: DUF177 domain-containing protein [Acetobacteraceae bacterium]|jgi:uncharacterized metal-binding protein YceD (DUF177 family)|nr:DUF177 domain-containing protein [Acetobacteraceae bacterium]